MYVYTLKLQSEVNLCVFTLQHLPDEAEIKYLLSTITPKIGWYMQHFDVN